MSTGRSDAGSVAAAGGLPLPLVLKVHPRARRLKLRLSADGSTLLLTLPPRADRARAVRWAREQADWVAAQLRRGARAEPIMAGALIPIDGIEHRLVHDPSAPRRMALADGALRIGGPADGLERRLVAELRARARGLLSDRTALFAAKAGVTVASVSVGDASTRWGSCSASGAIRYNWRLVMAPPAVRDWVVAHEVAHRLHMNHGPQFKAAEAALYGGDVDEARRLLRAWSPRLKRIGHRPGA